MLSETATRVKAAGAVAMRGGAFKPRSSPYSFDGLGEEGLKILAEVRTATGLPVVTEVMDTRQVELVAEYADVLQIGARNMQNFSLLTEVGRLHRPILLKRGMSAKIKDLLLAAEYIMKQGNMNVILCERGIRTFEDATHAAGFAAGSYPFLGWGVRFADLDQDGDLDLVAANGHVHPRASEIHAGLTYPQDLLRESSGEAMELVQRAPVLAGARPHPSLLARSTLRCEHVPAIHTGMACLVTQRSGDPPSI